MTASQGKKRPAGGRNRRSGKSLDNIVQSMMTDDSSDRGRSLDEKLQEHIESTQSPDDQAPVVMLVDALLKEALRRGASDIHIEPFETQLRIRFRIDGALQEIQKLPSKLTAAIISRLKIMAELDIVERKIPQDGVIRLRTADGDEADFRVSTLPSVFGEKAVLRVLNKDSLNKDLEQVGLPAADLEILKKQVSKPDGLVLVTGPTGSGKTTTLYASLSEINEPHRSIFTAEDPVEGTLDGITQVQINQGVGLSFSAVLRSLLRQDPDVILVGEIRDKETIDIAIKAALTGHLVLSTLHTNDTAATIQRLLNMGVANYLIASAVNLIVAQRLVRRICLECKEPEVIEPAVFEKMGFDPSEFAGVTIYKGAGCPKCSGTGYSGRVPLYEIMVMNEVLSEAILQGVSQAVLKHLARQHGLITLREAGINRVKEGITTLDEVLSKTHEDEDPPEVSSVKKSEEAGAAAAPGGHGSNGGSEHATKNLLEKGVDTLKKALPRDPSGSEITVS